MSRSKSGRVDCLSFGARSRAPRWYFVGSLLALSGCSGWFGDKSCVEGEERCDGTKVLTCVPKFTGGGEQANTWKKTNSCALLGDGFTCYAVDGIAQCRPRTSDGGVSAGFADAAAPAPFSDVFAAGPSAQTMSWTRFDISRVGATYQIARAKDVPLNFAPASASSGEFAAVSYDKSGKPLSAALVALDDQARGSVWLKADGTHVVRLLKPGGALVAESPLAESPASSTPKRGGVARTDNALDVAFPPTLAITPGLQSLHVLLGDKQIPLTTVQPTPEMLELVSGALRRMSPYAVSILTEVAFTDTLELFTDDVVRAYGDGGMLEVELRTDAAVASAATSSGLDGGVGGNGARLSSLLGRRRLAVIGSRLIVNVEDWSLSSFREAPLDLHLEIAREVALLFMRLTSVKPDPFNLTMGANFGFPADFPPEIAALIKERVSPLVGVAETFAGVWAGLHGIAVEGGLAYRYLPDLVGGLTDAEAVAAGFAARAGAQGSAQDFAEYFARATVPETWAHGPCSTIRSAPIDALDPKVLVHVAKLEALWGLGLLSTAQLQSCTGSLALQAGTQGVVAHKANGETIQFDRDIGGNVEPYYHGQTQVSLTAGRVDMGDEIAAAFTLSTHGAPTGLMRLTSVSHRPDAEVGASFFLSNARTYARSEATAGLLLVTRLDGERIESHALMVRQGSKAPFFEARVFPLVTARYDVPDDERGLVVE